MADIGGGDAHCGGSHTHDVVALSGGRMYCLDALCGAGMSIQLVALPAGSVIAYLLLVPLFRRKKTFVQKSDENSRTGMDALLGRRAVVTKEIRPGELGRARIDGDNWQVRAPGIEETLPRGADVSVTGYESIILEVKPVRG